MAEIIVACPECGLQAKVLPAENQVLGDSRGKLPPQEEPVELSEPKTLGLQSPSGIGGEPVPCDQGALGATMPMMIGIGRSTIERCLRRLVLRP
jgi:hypothetical protein